MGKKQHKHEPKSLSDVLRLPSGSVNIEALPTDSTEGFDGSKKDVAAADEALATRLSDLQERLFAQGRANPETAPRALVLLQGMDTAGKGGVVRHALGMVDPQGVQIHGFKAPTKNELRHNFLWRIKKALPEPGMIGVFDRSHYEDVLVVRVENLIAPEVWEQRYDQINTFEARLADQGISLVKCFLNVSYAEQGERLEARLDRPDKYWKYNPGDIDVRNKWVQYREAYQVALERCNTEHSPWYVVPADRKWYRNWAVATLLAEHLERLDLQWPEADFDVETEKARLAQTSAGALGADVTAD